MANRFLKTAGGNWNTAATWSATSAAGIDNAGVPTSSDAVILELLSGQLTIDVAAVCASFSMTSGTGSYTGTVTHNAFSLTVSGSITFSSGCTYTPLATSSVIMNAAGTLTTAGKLMPLLQTTAGTMTLGDNLNFMASLYMVFTIAGGVLAMNGKTVSGNSAINRVLITSGTIGTSASITSATTNFANADFRDIAFSSASNLDLSAITGKSGDCGGNTITGGGTVLTFTTTATQTWSGTSGGNWSANAWTSRVPLPQDNVVISQSFSAAQTIVADMPRLGKSIDFTGSVGLNVFQIGSGTTNTIYGSLTLVNSAGIIGFTKSGSAFIFEGRGSFTITSAGQTFGSGGVTVQAFGGTYTCQDAFAIAGTASLFTLNNGTFDANNFNISLSGNFSSSNSNLRTINMGSGTWTLSSTGGTIWNVATTTNLTLNASTSIILITDTGNSATTFQGGGKTYATLWYTRGASTGTNTIVGTNTFAFLQDTGSTAAHTLVFPNVTTTISSATGLVLIGSAGNLITLSRTGGSGTFTISCASGTIMCNYLSISNSVATGGAFFFAGAGSTDVSTNFGWIFWGGASWYQTMSPLTTVDDSTIGTVAWSNPNNSQVSDVVYATASTNATLSDNSIKMVKGGTIGGTDQSAAATWSIDPTETYDSFGSASNMWGQTLVPSDVNGSTFGVALGVKFGATISHYLKATNFGFNVPTTATIVGNVAQFQRTSVTCFIKGTKVSTPRGKVNIEDIEPGDMVFAARNGKILRVLAVSKNSSKQHFILKTEHRRVGATAEHPFLTTKGWRTAEKLKIGDRLRTEDGIEILTNKELITEETFVYNLTVENPHTYIANGFAVHNYITWTAKVDFIIMQVYFTMPFQQKDYFISQAVNRAARY